MRRCVASLILDCFGGDGIKRVYIVERKGGRNQEDIKSLGSEQVIQQNLGLNQGAMNEASCRKSLTAVPSLISLILFACYEEHWLIE